MWYSSLFPYLQSLFLIAAGALGVVGGVEWRIRLGHRVSVGSPPRHAIVTQLTPRAKISLVYDDNTQTKVSNNTCKINHRFS